MQERIHFLPGHRERLIQEGVLTKKKAKRGVTAENLAQTSAGKEKVTMETLFDELQNRACTFLVLDVFIKGEDKQFLKKILYYAVVQIPLLTECADILDEDNSDKYHKEILKTAKAIQAILETNGLSYLIALDKLESTSE